MDEGQVLGIWKRFSEKGDFKLNPDGEHVAMLAKGVLHNEEKHGLRLCPCRLRDGTREADLKLICPCNFKAQDTWKEKGMCWCGLFVKRD